MNIFAQHGYGPGKKITEGLKENLIKGVVLSPRYLNQKKINSMLQEYKECNINCEVLLDPEFFATAYINNPNPHLGLLNNWDYFEPTTRSILEDTETIDSILERYFEEVLKYGFTSIISPNIYIPKSFNSIEAVIAKNFIKRSKVIYNNFDDSRPLFASLALSPTVFYDESEFTNFLGDITAMNNGPDGFYLITGGNNRNDSSEITRSDLIDSKVISGWMLLNYSLDLNNYKTINGYSDILTPFLLAAGGQTGCTGWFSNLRTFTMGKYIKSKPGGQSPIVRYLSIAILNRIKHMDRELYENFAPEINNNLKFDEAFKGDDPNRNDEILQAWEAISAFSKLVNTSDNIENRLIALEKAIEQASNTYDKLVENGITQDIETNKEYLSALTESITEFRNMAEL